MAYTLMKTLIKKGKTSKATLIKKADVYYAVGQLSDDEYAEIMELINGMA